MARKPEFATVSVLTLALGIILNTAIFGIVNALWFGPLPFQNDREIVVLHTSNPSKGLSDLISYPDYADLQAGSRSFEGMAALAERSYHLTLPIQGAEPERVRGGVMSASALDLLGYVPVIGRGFSQEEEAVDDAASGPRVVLISEGLWRNRFGADAGIVGRKLKIDGHPATIIGVLPQTFRFIYGGYQVLAPLPRELVRTPREERSLHVLARVRRTTVEQVQAELDGISRRLAAQHPVSNEGWSISAEPFRQAVFGEAMRMYPILLAAAGMVLLLVCANLSNLLLAKTVSRHQELAIRMALGAGRMRVMQQVLAEGISIAVTGGAVALLSSIWMRNLLVASYPELAALQIDYRVVLYTLCASVSAGVVFALGPAFSVSGVDVNTSLKSGGRSATGQGYRFRSALVVSQLGLALMLLTGMGLLVRTAALLRGIDTGLDLRNVLAAEVSLQGAKYASVERRAQFWREVTDRLAALPGVETVAATSAMPLLAQPLPRRLEVAGRHAGTGGEYLRLVSSVVDPGYFDAVGIRLVAGRGFTAADHSDAPRVTIINQTLARLLWPQGEGYALGKQLRAGENSEWATVVGVHRDVRQVLPSPPLPELAIPSAQSAQTSKTLLVRTRTGVPANLADAVRRELRAVDAGLPLGEILTLDGILEKFYPKVMAGSLGIFSALAIALAALGLFGVISALVHGRTREIGVRITLGADRRTILRMVLWQGLRLVLVGIALGLAGALALTRALSGFLYGMSPAEPFVFAGAALLLTLTALVACALPAWRAARLNPVAALRSD